MVASLPSLVTRSTDPNCDGDPGDTVGHSQLSKEYQSAAATEGFADFYSAWLWNRKTESDCVYDRHYDSDFDLDGNLDNQFTNRWVNCEGDPFLYDTVPGAAPFNMNRDWMESVMNNTTVCNGISTNRSTQYDWLRYWWDMLTDEGIP